MSTAFLPALEQARLVRERQLSAVELVEDYLARIERLDPELNAYVTVCADEALAQARAPLEGPFAGVPLPIKDLVDTAGIPDDVLVQSLRGQRADRGRGACRTDPQR